MRQLLETLAFQRSCSIEHTRLLAKKITFSLLSLILSFQFGLANEDSKIHFSENGIPTSICMDCDNATNGGEIAGDEQECPNPIFDPSLITNVTLPSGGTGNLEYIWIFSTDVDPFGANAQWTPIIGTNAPEYDPDPINITTHYRRCARREGCTDYIGESNIVSKIIIEYPLTNIETYPSELCVNEGGTFVASIAGGGATYFWEFGNDATPTTANTRTVNNVSWSTAGFKPVILTVTRFGCSFSTSVLIEIVTCPTGNPIIVIDGMTAELLNDKVLVEWNSDSNDGNASYVIQKAKIGESFQTVGALKGNDSENNEYEFMDENPLLGESQYRVQRVDSENGMIYSEIVNVFYQPKDVLDVHFYPNPFTTKVTLDVIRTQDKPVQVQIINTFAHVMDSFEIPAGMSKKELDLSHLPNGMYYVNIKQDARKDYTFRVFKSD